MRGKEIERERERGRRRGAERERERERGRERVSVHARILVGTCHLVRYNTYHARRLDKAEPTLPSFEKFLMGTGHVADDEVLEIPLTPS